MEKLFWKECVKMKNKYASSYIYFKKKRFILLVSIVSFVVTILVVIGVVLIAMGLFHQEDSMSTLNLGNVEVEKAESVNQKEAEESNGFLLDVPYLSQEGEYPTACEIVSAVMVLSYYGYNVSIDDFIDDYLPKADIFVNTETGLLTSTSPTQAFIGDPRSSGGYGCYAPVIVSALNNAVGNTALAMDTTNTDIDTLVDNYVKRNIPVLLWASINLAPTSVGDSWILEDTGEWFTWTAGEHCMVLVGADQNYYYFNDPYNSNGTVKYHKNLVTKRWEELGKQSVVLVPTAISK